MYSLLRYKFLELMRSNINEEDFPNYEIWTRCNNPKMDGQMDR